MSLISKFIGSKIETLIPIIGSKSSYRKRKFSFDRVEDGWYKVKITDSGIKILSKADDLDLEDMYKKLPSICGFVHSNEIVPVSFETAKKKFQFRSESFPFYFNRSSSWSCVKCVVWETGQIFYWKDYLSSSFLPVIEIRSRFENNQDLKGIKGITPEMSYLYVLFSIERDMILELKKLDELRVAEEDRKRLREEFEKSLGGRLLKAFSNIGADLKNFTKDGNGNLEVSWEIDGERFNSKIRPSNFSIIESGFCVSGEDKKHTITSMVLTAKDFIDRDVVFKTRT